MNLAAMYINFGRVVGYCDKSCVPIASVEVSVVYGTLIDILLIRNLAH